MTADMSALIARLEAAEAKDAWIHAPDVHLALFGSSLGKAAKCPAYTSSIDAALALADRMFPGWAWEIRVDESGATVQGAPAWWMEGLAAPDEGGVSCDAATPAIALCIAILRAKQGDKT